MEEEWTLSDRECADCGTTLYWRGWWDDAPENGGACIGTQFSCENCETYFSE